MVVFSENNQTGYERRVGLRDLEGDPRAHGNPSPDPILFGCGKEGGETGAVGVSVQKERCVFELGMGAFFAECGESVEQEGARPEAALHGVSDELEECEAEFGCDGAEVGPFEEGVTAAVAGDGHDSAHGFHSVGNPEIEFHFLRGGGFLLFH